MGSTPLLWPRVGGLDGASNWPNSEDVSSAMIDVRRCYRCLLLPLSEISTLPGRFCFFRVFSISRENVYERSTNDAATGRIVPPFPPPKYYLETISTTMTKRYALATIRWKITQPQTRKAIVHRRPRAARRHTAT